MSTARCHVHRTLAFAVPLLLGVAAAGAGTAVPLADKGKALAKIYVTGSIDASVRVWDGRSGEALLALRNTNAEASVWGVGFSQDGRTIFSGDRLGGVTRWRTRE